MEEGGDQSRRVSDETIIDACRLHILLRDIVDKEDLSAVSIDCLGFTMGPNPVLPYPCLAFGRLRDEGVAAACEADVCGMLSSMFLETVSRKPSFMCNLMSVDPEDSKIVVSHCVAPLKLNGRDASGARCWTPTRPGGGRSKTKDFSEERCFFESKPYRPFLTKRRRNHDP